jgi:hypothetical protein
LAVSPLLRTDHRNSRFGNVHPARKRCASFCALQDLGNLAICEFGFAVAGLLHSQGLQLVVDARLPEQPIGALAALVSPVQRRVVDAQALGPLGQRQRQPLMLDQHRVPCRILVPGLSVVCRPAAIARLIAFVAPDAVNRLAVAVAC